MRQVIAALAAGTLFGAGLTVGGMTDPARVRGFLDLFGNWDPTLAFVMGGAVLVMAIAWRVQKRVAHPLLAEEFLQNFAERHGRPRCHLSSDAVEYMQSQAWPGNVRQLKHELERAAIFNSGGTIDRATFQGPLEGAVSSPQVPSIPALAAEPGSEGFALKDCLQKVEDDLIQATMTRCRGNKKKVAEELGISRSYLYKKLAEIGGYD